MVAETPQHGIDGIEQVAAHHTDFVDYENVKGAQNLAFLLAEVISVLAHAVGNVWGKGQLEEGMDGNSAGIYGCHARRRDYNHTLAALGGKTLQECCLAGSGLTGKENAFTRVLNEVPCVVQLFVCLHTLSF